MRSGIRRLLVGASAVSVDETPIRVGPAQPAPGRVTAGKHLHVACTDTATDYVVGGRGIDTFTETVIPDLDVNTVLVHDRYQNYDSPALGAHTHQLCNAHLLRDIANAAQVYPDQAWPAQISDALQALIHQTNHARQNGAAGIDPGTCAWWVRVFRSGVQIGLNYTRHTTSASGGVLRPGERKVRLLLETLRDREADVLRFTHDLRVPPTSNQAERDLRPAKIQQKISGRLTSVARTVDRYGIRSYTSTAIKHGLHPYDALYQVVISAPWMPPDPAPG